MANTRKLLDTNMKLAGAAALLLLLSGLTYWHDVSRADRFESGRKLLQNLNPDEISKIVITKDGKTTTLTREDDRFLVAEQHGYRARNDVVNRTIRNLLDIELAREIGSSDNVEANTGIAGEEAKPTEVTLFNGSGEEMVHVIVGANADEGTGTFVKRADDDASKVYLTQQSLSLDTDSDEFLDKEIVNVAASEVERIEGPDFVIARPEEGGELELVEPKAKGKSSEISKLSSFLNRLRFDSVVVADDPQVVGLAFTRALRFELKDKSGYRVFSAQDGDNTYVKVGAFYGIDRIEVGQDSSDQEVKEKAEILKRSDEVKRFNEYSGQWVYKLESFNADKLELRAADLRE